MKFQTFDFSAIFAFKVYLSYNEKKFGSPFLFICRFFVLGNQFFKTENEYFTSLELRFGINCFKVNIVKLKIKADQLKISKCLKNE